MSPARSKVCHLITKLELGGAQQNTLYTCSQLDPQQFEVSLIAGPGGELDQQASRAAYPFEISPQLVRPIAPAADLRALIDLTRRLKRLQPAIVHTHSSKAGILGRMAASLAGVPVIVHTVHGWGFHPGQTWAKRALFIWLERAMALITTQWIVVSRANAEQGQRRRIAPREQFELIRSGVELNRFRRARNNGRLRAELQLTDDQLLVGMVACLKPQKAPLDFVAVAEQVIQQHPNALFVLVGDGELRGDVENAIATAGLEQNVRLLGWRRDVPHVVGDLDLLLLTSRHEGLPRVIPEAMAAGKPVVATAVDGSPEAVTQNETGFLRAAGDVDGLASDVTRLLSDSALRQRMGSAAAERVEPWDIDEMVRRQEQLYQRLLQRVGLARSTRATRENRTALIA